MEGAIVSLGRVLAEVSFALIMENLCCSCNAGSQSGSFTDGYKSHAVCPMSKPRRERTRESKVAPPRRPWPFVHLSSMIAAVKKIAVLLKAEIYWPRPEGLLIGLRTMNNPASRASGEGSSQPLDRWF
jgi:hypothetical protein